MKKLVVVCVRDVKKLFAGQQTLLGLISVFLVSPPTKKKSENFQKEFSKEATSTLKKIPLTINRLNKIRRLSIEKLVVRSVGDVRV